MRWRGLRRLLAFMSFSSNDDKVDLCTPSLGFLFTRRRLPSYVESPTVLNVESPTVLDSPLVRLSANDRVRCGDDAAALAAFLSNNCCRRRSFSLRMDSM